MRSGRLRQCCCAPGADRNGVALVAVAAVGFGLGGPLARAAGDVGFNGVTFAFWRSAGSVAALAAMLLIGVAMGRLPRVSLRSIGRLEWLQLRPWGCSWPARRWGCSSAIERTTIALTLIVFYTYPVIVAVAAVRIYGEPLDRAAFGGHPAGLVRHGAGGARSRCHRRRWRGPAGRPLRARRGGLPDRLRAGGGARLRLRALVPGSDAAAWLLAAGHTWSCCAACVLLIGDGDRLLGPLDGLDAWLLIVIAGVFSAALPTAGLVAGYRRVGPTRGAVLMLLEPLTGVLLAAMLLAERPAPIQLLGGLLVLAGGAGQLARLRGRADTEPVAE